MVNTQENNEIIVTLYEGHYHYGVAALINSLVAAEFKGLLLVSYRGQLPPWVNQFQKLENQQYKIDEYRSVSFIHLNVKMHFGFYKPIFLKEALSNYPLAQRIYYFDPDIVVNAPWTFFSTWVNSGVALCLDNCFHFVHRNHPWRREWIVLANVNLEYCAQIDYYVNSGFIGLKRANVVILDEWISMTKKYENSGETIYSFVKDGHRAFKGDQDLLNAVLTVFPGIKISLIGKEGMAFSQPAYLMSHAVNNIKPWKNNFLKDLISRGFAPGIAEKDYFKHANYPISPYSKGLFLVKSIDIKFASILSRILAIN